MRSLTLKSLSTFSPSHLRYTHTTSFLFARLCSFSSLSKTPSLLFANFLIDTLHFSKTRALTLSTDTRYSNLKSLERPEAVVRYFQNLGFSEQQIQFAVRGSPKILLYDIVTLKPKIEYFQQLGLAGSHLGKFFSKTSFILTFSLEKKLVPSVEMLKKILVNDTNNENLFKILSRSSGLYSRNIDSSLLPNIKFLESCGIVGDRLAMLLRKNPRLFTMEKAALRKLVSRVSDMGFDIKSRMFAHALSAVCRCSVETFERKAKTFKSFGFTKDEYMEMVRKSPEVLSISTEKSIVGLDFYLKTVGFAKEVLIRNPNLLTISMENRVIPRYRVLQVIKCKKLLKKERSFLNVLKLREEVFMKRFISKFTYHKEELLKAYKGHTLDCSSKEEISTS